MPSHRRTHRSLIVAGALLLGAASLMAGCESNIVLRTRGETALRRGEVALASQQVERAVEQDATDWRAHHLLGLIRMEQGRYLDARLAFDKALGILGHAPEADDVLDDLAEAIYRQGDSTGLQEFLARVASQSNTSRGYLRQGRYLSAIGAIDDAKLAFAKAQRLAGPQETEPYLAAATFFESIGDQQSAITSLRRAYTIAPQREQAAIGERLRQHGVVPGPSVALPGE